MKAHKITAGFFILILMFFGTFSTVNAEIQKNFNRAKREFTINSEKTIKYDESTSIKVIITKCFFFNEEYTSNGLPSMSMVIQVSEPLLKRVMTSSFYWVVEGEPYRHQEQFTNRGNVNINSFVVSQELKNGIWKEKTIYMKIPMSAGEPLMIMVKPELLREWKTVLDYDVRLELKKIKGNDPGLLVQ